MHTYKTTAFTILKDGHSSANTLDRISNVFKTFHRASLPSKKLPLERLTLPKCQRGCVEAGLFVVFQEQPECTEHATSVTGGDRTTVLSVDGPGRSRLP